ncbi:MAG TPA: DUF4173 domain-containing protein [Candidatus Limnocylindria bacterium]|nr:DUF4173 domain-containing protein [Candidatus Limnocylindria bacterium]
MSADTPAFGGSEPASAAAAVGTRPRLSAAGRVAALAVTAGIIGQLLFVGASIGVNFPLAILTALGAAVLARRREARFDHADWWLPASAVALASFAALRGDPVLVFLDVVASLCLMTASLAAIAGHRVTRRLLPGLAELAGRVLRSTLVSGGYVAADAAIALRPGDGTRQRLAGARPILRGLLIALPMVIVFTALFASADAVFARIVGDLFRVDADLGELPGRVAVACAIAWVAAGALAFVAEDVPRADPVVGDRYRVLGSTEAVVVLIAVNAVFTVFVVLQAAYLFGGLDTLSASGQTYAEYARRGFFELLAVAALAGGLILIGEAIIRRRTRPYVGGAIGLMVLTAVVLASAFLRLRIYQDAYGWTELRFYVLASIGWLAICLVMAIVALWLDRSRWLVHGLVMAAVAVALVINLVGPVRFVATQNLERAFNPALVPADGWSGLDAAYAGTLGDDAVPLLAEALPQLPTVIRGYLEDQLASRRADLARSEANTWQAWNLGREQAKAALDR